jgi:hypothetical protein
MLERERVDGMRMMYQFTMSSGVWLLMYDKN